MSITHTMESITPACKHFGTCGGCQLQHLPPALYATFKQQHIENALEHAKITPQRYDEIIILPPHTRRRGILKALRGHGSKIELGYFQRQSHQVVDVQECPLLDYTLTALFSPLRTLLKDILAPRQKAEIAILASQTGVDMALSYTPAPLDLSLLERLTHFAQTQDLARLRLNGEVIVTRKTPMVNFCDTLVEADALGFLQASNGADDALTSWLMKLTSSTPPKKAVDLFCGRGLFSHALATKATHVTAYDMDLPALTALKNSCKNKVPNIHTHQRQLFANPLKTSELNAFDFVLLDPPRAGAPAQCKELAASSVPKSAYVSCSPQSFARDAGYLIKGGYALTSVQGLDQFLWSQHIEIMGLFEKMQ